MRYEISQPMSAIGLPTEAITQSLCDTRAGLEALLNAVTSLLRINQEILEKLSDIEDAIIEGTNKANEGIEAARETRGEIQQACSELRGHKEELMGHKEELRMQRERSGGPERS